MHSTCGRTTRITTRVVCLVRHAQRAYTRRAHGFYSRCWWEGSYEKPVERVRKAEVHRERLTAPRSTFRSRVSACIYCLGRTAKLHFDRVGSDLLQVRVQVPVRDVSSLFHRPHEAGCPFLLGEAADESEEVINGLLCCLYVHD